MDKIGGKKKCFVITPIGEINSEIRRHIDGIIDRSIALAIGDKYEIEVAHRKYEIGSINDRVIRNIYEADLVIANLTTLNPNVMFELAIRYSFGKPAIVIAEQETKLPFDIVDENTLFYVNDPTGAHELEENIRKFESNIDFDRQTYGPVFKAINNIPLYNSVESGGNISMEELLSYVIKRLDTIESSALLVNPSEGIEKTKDSWKIICNFNRNDLKEDTEFYVELHDVLKRNGISVLKIDSHQECLTIEISTQISRSDKELVRYNIQKLILKHGILNYSIEIKE